MAFSPTDIQKGRWMAFSPFNGYPKSRWMAFSPMDIQRVTVGVILSHVHLLALCIWVEPAGIYLQVAGLFFCTTRTSLPCSHADSPAETCTMYLFGNFCLPARVPTFPPEDLLHGILYRTWRPGPCIPHNCFQLFPFLRFWSLVL